MFRQLIQVTVGPEQENTGIPEKPVGLEKTDSRSLIGLFDE